MVYHLGFRGRGWSGGFAIARFSLKNNCDFSGSPPRHSETRKKPALNGGFEHVIAGSVS